MDHKGSADGRQDLCGGEPAKSTGDAVLADQAARTAEATAAKISNFVPMSLRGEDAEVVAAVMPTARRYVATSEPTDPTQARRFLRSVADLLAERIQTGEALDPEVDLHPDTINRFINIVCGDRSVGWRHDTQWVLTQVGRAVVPRLHPVRREAVGKHKCTDPHSLSDEQVFLAVASLRFDQGYFGDAWVVVAVFALGMKGPEARVACRADLFELGDGRLAAQVRGRHSRVVPVRKPYLALARALLETSGDGSFVPNNGSNFDKIPARLVVHGGPRLSLVRGRLSWIKAHLVAGTPPAVLRKLAGPISIDTLNHLLGAAATEIPDEQALIEGLRA